MVCVGIGGQAHGRGADLLILEDSMKATDAGSQALRDHIDEAYQSAVLTRLEPGAKVILVMSRLHRRSLWPPVGEGADRWNVVLIPAIAEVDEVLGDWHRTAGTSYWPDRYSLEELTERRAQLGSAIWLTQYQQSPELAAQSGERIAVVGWGALWTVLSSASANVVSVSAYHAPPSAASVGTRGCGRAMPSTRSILVDHRDADGAIMVHRLEHRARLRERHRPVDKLLGRELARLDHLEHGAEARRLHALGADNTALPEGEEVDRDRDLPLLGSGGHADLEVPPTLTERQDRTPAGRRVAEGVDRHVRAALRELRGFSRGLHYTHDGRRLLC
jgi:hypothetical protein